MAEAKDTKSSTSKATETATAAPKDPAAADPKRSAADLDADRNLGRTTGGTTEAQQDEYAKLGVNPRLDNRTGDQRPILADKIKPQQVDGPEVGHFAEHAERFADEYKNVLLPNAVEGEVYGMKSEGPHGRGPHGVTVGDEHGQPVPVEGSAGDAKDPRNPA